MAVTAPIAVRILALRSLGELQPNASCRQILSEDQWRCLFVKVRGSKILQRKPPSIHDALLAIAKLGGWRDTKRNGRIGWQSLWRGWTKLEILVEGWCLARSLNEM